MTGKDILKAMNYLEDELVEKSVQKTAAPATQVTEVLPVRSHRSKFTKTALKWTAAAAAAILFLGGGVAYAAKYGIFRTNPDWESGYHVDITSRRVTEEEFSEEVRAVKQELLEDIAAAKDAENNPYFGWIQDFNSVEESVEFIGHTEMKVPVFPGTLEQTGVTVVGNNNAELLQVCVFARTSLGRITMTGTATVYTTTMFPETGAGIKEDGIIYKDEVYITKNGKEAVILLPEEYVGNSGIQGYLVDGSVIYELWILCYEEEHDQAMKIMKEWLDQF